VVFRVPANGFTGLEFADSVVVALKRLVEAAAAAAAAVSGLVKGLNKKGVVGTVDEVPVALRVERVFKLLTVGCILIS